MGRIAPINHSDLTQQIYAMARMAREPERIKMAEAIVVRSSGGVVEEGGILVVADPQRAINVMNQASPAPSLFQFGKGSTAEMVGVDKRLVKTAKLALTFSTQDFIFFHGLRTIAEQRKLVQRGMSKTMNSKHIEGLAMDLVPYHQGRAVWDWKLIYPVVMAVDQAATQLGFADLITWGGAWDRTLADFGGSASAYEEVVQEYCDRHPGKDFIDGPHFQIRGPKQ